MTNSPQPVLKAASQWASNQRLMALALLFEGRAAVEAIPDGVETAIERVGEYDLGQAPIPPPLTPRQREALTVATDAGYYDVPRGASRDDVAERLGCAPSTASEHLRKAEGRLVRTFLDVP